MRQKISADRALYDLHRTACLVKLALEATDTAAHGLQGARLVRSNELHEKLADCIAYAERLAFVVTGDIRADQDAVWRTR
jgi:hypothetical protein